MDVIDEYQIRTVVNLCDEGEMTPAHWADERRAVRAAGARVIEIPMPLSVNVTDRQIGQHLEVLQDPDNYPLLVHCQHGVTRTAKFLAIYDIAFRRMTARDSLAAQPLFGRDQHNVHVRAFARNFEKSHLRLYQAAVPAKLDVLRD
jgi:protein tyrosine/serine phosphatase